jgi:hypothetical protein
MGNAVDVKNGAGTPQSVEKSGILCWFQRCGRDENLGNRCDHGWDVHGWRDKV